ncbi:GAF domain-containing protein [Naasia lichenicola]|uniref:GAF domain-containing protein n=1 Tax=Naasia lichenicola TaxID=2565933 RepID=A0A4S4FNE6_9MICO|nr:GAF domain-containing protein [Naasia lichenicola]THG30752.1 hypothetical protein E6C64_08930 [Naasia lichenicola]THG31989.1 hypothetical protein E6C64_08075 [Naasia lichenicola]
MPGPGLQLPRPFRSAWKNDETFKLNLIPRPSDAPQVHASGPDPDRILVVGTGAVVGWGVSSHDLAFSGQLARQLSEITARGVDVDVITEHGLTASATLRKITDLRLWRYDAIIISVGTAEALRLDSTARWSNTMSALIADVAEQASATTQMIVFGIPPVGSMGPFGDKFGRQSDRLAKKFDAITEEICAQDPRISFRSLPEKGSPVQLREIAPRDLYRMLAGSVAAQLAPKLERSCADNAQISEWGAHYRRGKPQNEDQRQAALTAMNILQLQPSERLDRITRLAQQMFSTEVAAITLMDGDRQVFKSVVGFDDVVIPREYSFCNETIKHEAPTVFRDMGAMKMFGKNPLVHAGPKARFYAGYPIESPDGYRIGAVCVIDSKPRPEGDLDLVGLRDLAMAVQKEMFGTAVPSYHI